MTTWADFSKKLASQEKPQWYEIYQISWEETEENFEELFETCSKMLDQVDFTKKVDEDPNAKFATTLIAKCLPGGNQIKRKNKDKLFNGLITVLKKIKDKPFSDEETCGPKVVESVSWILPQADLLTKKYVPDFAAVFADILKQKKVAKRVWQNFLSPVMTICMNCPEECTTLGPQLVRICFEEEYLDFLSIIGFLYSVCPDDINKHVGLMIELIEEENRLAAHLPSLLQKIAPRNPELLVPHLKLFVNKMENDKMMYSLYCMILNDIASKCIKDFTPFMDDVIKIFSQQEPGIVFYGGKIINMYYKDSKDDKKIKIVYDVYFARASKDPDMYLASNISCIAEFAKCSDLHRDILKDNYSKLLGTYLEKPNTKAITQSIIDYLHNRSLENLDVRIDIAEDKVEQVKTDMKDVKKDVVEMKQDVKEVKEDVKKLDSRLTNLENVVEEHKKWVAENLDQIKTSMAKLGKVLPIPVNMTIKSNIIDSISLHFICAYKKDKDCSYPGDEENCNNTFTTQTKEINKWCKIGVQAVSLGFKIFNGDIYNGLANIKNMWDIYSDKKQDKFDTWTQEPFLTSSEQDELILQLRKSSFYQEFEYDPAHNGWSCLHCLGKLQSSQAPQSENLKQKQQNQEISNAMGEILDTTRNVFPPNAVAQQPHQPNNKDQNAKVAQDMMEQVKEIQESAGCSCHIL